MINAESELSEWQRSADDAALLRARKLPGTATVRMHNAGEKPSPLGKVPLQGADEGKTRRRRKMQNVECRM